MLAFADWIVPCILLTGIGMIIRWFIFGPSRRTREQVAKAVESRGFKLLSVKPKPEIRLGRNSRWIIRVRAKNAFGNAQTMYFDVDPVSDIFSVHPRVREFGSGLNPSRFVVVDSE